MADFKVIINSQEHQLIPLGYCACGCGGKTTLAKQTDSKRHKIKGQPTKYIMGHQSKKMCGLLHPNWKGGRFKRGGGYINTYDDNHNIRQEHTIIAEKVLGKPLPARAVVHHADENTGNNRNNNLVICQDRAYHLLLHRRMRAMKACGHAGWRKCKHCHNYDSPDNLIIKPQNTTDVVYHRECYNRYNRLLYRKHHPLSNCISRFKA